MNSQQNLAANQASLEKRGDNNTFINQPKTVVHAPVVQETVRNDRLVEVQPILHREVDKNVVHHIEKHINEPRAPSMGGVVERNPLVQQQVHTNVVNEIQPVIHRERVVPVAERVEQHLQQRIVEPTVHTHEVVYENAPLGGSNLSTVNNINNGLPLNQGGLNQGLNQGGLNQGVLPTEQHKHGLFHRH